MEQSKPCRQERGGLSIARSLLIAVIVTFAVTTLIAFSMGHFSPLALAYSFLYGSCYAVACGGLMMAALPRLMRSTEHFAYGLQLTVYFLAVLLLSVPGTLLANAALIIMGLETPADFWENVRIGGRIAAVISLINAAGFLIYERKQHQIQETQARLRDEELAREAALRGAAQAKIQSLESRIRPHFLFNTLNSISSLIQSDPQRADAMVQKLASLLRFSLDSEHRGLAPLEEELKIVREYLEIEQTRFGGRLRFELDVPDELSNAAVPPLSIQTLVENSVKYAVSPRRDGGVIGVRARAHGVDLVIDVWDDGPGFEVSAILPGHGIDTLQRRLETLFGATAGLELPEREEGVGCIARFRLPLQTEPGGSATAVTEIETEAWPVREG